MRAIKYWAVVLCVLACCARGNISNRPVSRRHTLRLLSLPRLVRNEECLRGDSVSCARLVLADCRVKKASDADNAFGELSADCEDHSSGPSTFIEQVEGLHVQLLDVVLEAVAQTRGVRALRKVVAVSPALRSRVLGSESIWRLLCVDEGFPPLEREVMGAEALDKDDSSFSQHSHGWGEFLWWDESASDKGDGKLTRANLRLTTGTSRGGTRVSRWAAAFARGETQQGRVRHAAELLRAFGGALFALNPGLSNSEIAAIERASCLRLPPALRALYREFDGQDRLCLEGALHGKRLLPLAEVAADFVAARSSANARQRDTEFRALHADTAPHLLADLPGFVISEDDGGYQRYLCAERSGELWLEAGFSLTRVAESLAAFLAAYPGNRIRCDMMRGSRQRSREQEEGWFR